MSALLTALGLIFLSITCIALGLAICVSASERIPGVNEPGRMGR